MEALLGGEASVWHGGHGYIGEPPSLQASKFGGLGVSGHLFEEVGWPGMLAGD